LASLSVAPAIELFSISLKDLALHFVRLLPSIDITSVACCEPSSPIDLYQNVMTADGPISAAQHFYHSAMKAILN
jgi:hypothetical protein